MSYWIQHGYGKGDKIDRLSDSGSTIGGVVLSPADEVHDTLAGTARTMTEHGIEFAIDPQTYVYTIADGYGRCHDENGLDFQSVDWSQDAADTESQVEAVVKINHQLGSSYVIAPGPLQKSLLDVWSALFFQYARATVRLASKPVLASVVVDESAFAQWNTVEDWLDRVTTLNVDGFYLVVSRTSSAYPPTWSVQILGNVLRCIYSLAELNEYRVLWGYSDLAGVLGAASGASGVASGWYYSLRSFTEGKWQPSSGGRQPTPRVLAPGLFSTIEAEAEGRAVANSRLGASAIPSQSTRQRLRNSSSEWGQTDAWYQFMSAMSEIISDLPNTSSVRTRLDWVSDSLSMARSLFIEMQNSGVVVSPSYETRLGIYEGAIDHLITNESL